MTNDQKTFADFVISGKNPKDAALLVWTGISEKTARNKSAILMKNEEISGYIRAQGQAIGEKISESLTTKIANEKVSQLMSSAMKRSILAQIISGKYRIEKTIIVDGKRKKVKVKPDLNDIMKAIEIDNKMSGDLILAKPNEVAKAEKVTKIIVVEDQTQPNGGDNHNK